jgi:zinc and cadmium transporter
MTTSRWICLVAAIVLDGAVALAGGLVPDAWLARGRTQLLGFAAGTLLAAALLDILPEALAARGDSALWWVAGTVVAITVGQALSGHDDHEVTSPLRLLASDALHNLGDGIAIAAAFVVSIRLGIVTALAVLVHELPEEVGDYALLRATGMPRRPALVALVAIQGTAAIGAAGALVAAAETTRLAGVALAIAAGTFLVIATADLLPVVAGARDRAGGLAGFACGVAVIALQVAYL